MRKCSGLISLVVLVALLAGCATAPLGPRVLVMPPPNAPLDLFTQDQKECKEFAARQMGGQEAMNNANQNTAGGAVAGAIAGAAIGAIFGAIVRNPGAGAAWGAGIGTGLGMSSGAANARMTQAALQQWYDDAYMQCMYVKGNLVPGMAPAAPAAVPPPSVP